MGKLFCMMGKSASGKDTIFKALVADESLGLKTVIPYTTRPVREGEAEGVEYWFVGETQFERFKREGKIIEDRCYQTVYGPWRYFMVDDGRLDLSRDYFLVIGTPESYCKIRDYFGADKVVPLYIDVEDGLRLSRAVARERRQAQPKYAELCRRFLADSEDFSEEKLAQSGIGRRFDNTSLEACIAQVKDEIRCHMQGGAGKE